MPSEEPPRDQEIRQRLFDVLTEFPVLYQARQGVGSKIVNPFASLERVVRAHVNPLILFINDVIQEVQKGLSYLEALDRVTMFALRHKYRDRIVDAIRQLARIEGERPYFLWGLAALMEGPDMSARARRLQQWHRRLHLMNRQFCQQYGAEGNVDLVPWRVTFRAQTDGITDGTYEFPTRVQLDTFRRALWAMDRLIREQRLDRWLHRGTARRIREDMVELARLLFDYGYSVEEICGRIREDESALAPMLNDLLLGDLESSVADRMDAAAVSRHVVALTLLDFRAMIPFRTLYCRPSQTEEALAAARQIEHQLQVKVSPFRRVVQLHRRYRDVHPALLAHYLEFQFSRSHGDYLPVRDAGSFGVDLTRQFVLRYFDKGEIQQKATEEARRLYSSKASQEMLEVLNLLISALSHPEQIRGKKVHILGHIQSGAMGKVLIGVYQANIVALKEPTASRDSRMPLSEQARHLEYEARLHGHVQSGRVQHENIVECFGILEEDDHRFLALGYHPAETLGALLLKSRLHAGGVSEEGRAPMELGDLKTVSIQMLRALIHLKERRVIHRDLKPGNVLYLVDGEQRVSLIKLIDFGVALGIAEGHPQDLFRNQVVGTMAYMAPELVFRECSYATDLYSVGVMLYQLMSGRLPVAFGKVRTKDELKVQLRRVVQERRTPLLEANPSLASEPALRGLAQHVDQMIIRDPTRRPPLEGFYEAWLELWRPLDEASLRRPLGYA
jgi:hypothetical protein